MSIGLRAAARRFFLFWIALVLAAPLSLGILASLLGSQNAFSAEAPVPSPTPSASVLSTTSFQVHERDLEFDGENVQYELHEHLDAYGEREVIIERTESRLLVPDTHVAVLYGRDLDGDGLYDAWFYPGNDGIMVSVDQPSTEPDGWDAASQILLAHSDPKNRNFFVLLLGSIADMVSLTAAHNQNLLNDISMQEIDLDDIDIRAQRIEKQNPKSAELLTLYETESDGWADISSRLAVKNDFLWALGDIAVYVSGSAILKGLGVLGRWIGPKLLDSSVASGLSDLYDTYMKGLADRIAVVAQKLGAVRETSKTIAAVAISPVRFLNLAIKDRISVIVKALEGHGEIGKILIRGIELSEQSMPAIERKGRYALISQSTQFISELVNRQDALFDPNPIILKNPVMTDRDLTNNVNYITQMKAETQDDSPAVQTAVLSTVTAGLVSYWVQQQHDANHRPLDAGWKALIGNLRTTFDLEALQYFETASQKADQPALKLVGYLVVSANQLIGDETYAKGSEAYNAYQKREAQKNISVEDDVKFVPLMAPAN